MVVVVLGTVVASALRHALVIFEGHVEQDVGLSFCISVPIPAKPELRVRRQVAAVHPNSGGQQDDLNLLACERLASQLARDLHDTARAGFVARKSDDGGRSMCRWFRCIGAVLVADQFLRLREVLIHLHAQFGIQTVAYLAAALALHRCGVHAIVTTIVESISQTTIRTNCCVDGFHASLRELKELAPQPGDESPMGLLNELQNAALSVADNSAMENLEQRSSVPEQKSVYMKRTSRLAVPKSYTKFSVAQHEVRDGIGRLR